ncbi:MAG: spore coat protein [Paenibacillus sp.]|jgi:spore germination protein Q|nr:spore coat protein [Paenibacillus sp.]
MMNMNPYQTGAGAPKMSFPSMPQSGSGMPSYGSGMMPQPGTGFPSYGPSPMPPVTTGGTIPGMPGPSPMLPAEESFVENILRLNLGKTGTFYMTYENNSEWNAKIFRGVIEAAGRDHIIISDPKTGMRYLLLMVNLDYVTFNEELNYTYPFR